MYQPVSLSAQGPLGPWAIDPGRRLLPLPTLPSLGSAPRPMAHGQWVLGLWVHELNHV